GPAGLGARGPRRRALALRPAAAVGRAGNSRPASLAPAGMAALRARPPPPERLAAGAGDPRRSHRHLGPGQLRPGPARRLSRAVRLGLPADLARAGSARFRPIARRPAYQP